MSDSIFNRPRRAGDPRDERAPVPAPGPDQGGADRRDSGADALLELARLIGQTEPFAPAPRAGEARQPDGRVAEAPFGANSPDRGSQTAFMRPPAREPATSQDRPYEDQSLGGRPLEERAAGRPLQPASRDEYPVAPRQGHSYDEDYDRGDDREDRPPVYGPDDEYSGEYLDDESGQDGEYDYEDDEHSDESESGSRRRSTTKIVIAVLGLAVFGSAAAFGYRTIFKAAPSGPTPIIRADNSPTKVVPAGTDAPKAVNDRLGDSPGERLVRRDEDPVDVGTTYRSVAGDSGYRTGASDTGYRSADAGGSGPYADTSGVPPTTVPAAGALTAPSDAKRVRTVPIRTDQGANPSAPDRMVVPDRPVSPDRAASRPAPPPSPPRTVAALTAPGTSAAPAVAPEPAPARAADAGGFVVQLSAQRSEADAQASFRTIQTKYSSVLNGQQPLIRRKDQGDRGVFYAAQVGPFGAKSDADQLCEALKSAGGSCFVQKN